MSRFLCYYRSAGSMNNVVFVLFPSGFPTLTSTFFWCTLQILENIAHHMAEVHGSVNEVREQNSYTAVTALGSGQQSVPPGNTVEDGCLSAEDNSVSNLAPALHGVLHGIRRTSTLSVFVRYGRNAILRPTGDKRAPLLQQCSAAQLIAFNGQMQCCHNPDQRAALSPRTVLHITESVHRVLLMFSL